MFRRKYQPKTASSGIKEQKRVRKKANNPGTVSTFKFENVRDITIVFDLCVECNAHHTLVLYLI